MLGLRNLDSETLGRIRQLLPVMGVALVVLGLPFAIARDLWVQDEARYGAVVQEMLASGQYLVPHLNGHPYPDKPPLYFWLVALIGCVTGHSEWAFRSIGLLSGIAAIEGVRRIGQALDGPSLGMRCALVYASFLVSLIVGGIMRMDMLLAATVAWTLLAFVHVERDRPRWAPLFWLGVCTGVAVKGPIALAFSLCPALVALVWVHGWRGLRRLGHWYLWLSLPMLVAVWMAAVIAGGYGDYLQQIWRQQLLGRALDSWSHQQPIWFYLALLPLLLFPWTAPALSGIWRLSWQRQGEQRIVLAYALVPLLAISLASGKLFIYVQPLLPSLALAAALTWQRWHLEGTVPLAARLATAGLGLVLAGGLLLLAQRISPAHAWAPLLIAALVVWVALIIGSLWVHAMPGWSRLLTASALLLSAILWAGLAPLAADEFSPRAAAELLRRVAPPGTPLALVDPTRGIFNYYYASNAALVEIDAPEAAHWWQDHPDAVLVIKDRDLARVLPSAEALARCRLQEQFSLELKTYHVLADCH